ncbi:MAG: 50S ribosomal protein L29 [Gemmataceae bacterium]|jgi:large subunit ribosomal protein L29|nr:50S ribosomal protein L29 [Gemmataceae bacterium]
MKATELRNLGGEELASALKDAQKRLFELRFQAATDRLETPDAIKKTRRDVARIKTIQREKERAAAPAA